MKIRRTERVIVLAGLMLVGTPGLQTVSTGGAAPLADAPRPGDYIVDTESPECPAGGPIFRITQGGQASVIAQGGLLQKPRGNAVLDDSTLLVADGSPNSGGLLKVNLQTGAVSKLVANPPYQPRDVVIDPQGNFIVVDWPEGALGRDGRRGAPPGPMAVYRVTPGGSVSMIAAGPPLDQVHGVALDRAGNIIVSGQGVWRVSPDGQVTVVHGAGAGTGLAFAADVRVDTDGNYVVTDIGAGALVKITPDGQLTTIHRGPPFSTGRASTNPQSTVGVGGPRGVVIDNDGNYIVVDELANAVFLVTPEGTVSTIFRGAPLCGPADVTIYKPLPPKKAPVTDGPALDESASPDQGASADQGASPDQSGDAEQTQPDDRAPDDGS